MILKRERKIDRSHSCLPVLSSLVSMVTEYCWAGRQAAHSSHTALKHIQDSVLHALIHSLINWHTSCTTCVNDKVAYREMQTHADAHRELHSYNNLDVLRHYTMSGLFIFILKFVGGFVCLSLHFTADTKGLIFPSLRIGRSVIRCLHTRGLGLSHMRMVTEFCTVFSC